MSVDSALGEDHEVLGSEFCSGFSDAQGKWNNGFYCPSGDAEALYCCGPPTDKYCCDRPEHLNKDDFSSLPLLLGVVTGIIAAISIVTLMSCCFCSCCILYKKRQPTSNGGPLYQLQCSSTTSGVANMYSFSNQNSIASTPIDTAVLVDMEPAARNVDRSYMPRGHHTFSCEPDPAPRPDVLCEAGPRIRSIEPPPPYDSPASFTMREHLANQQIKRHHIQLPQPPQHPPPLPPIQLEDHVMDQIGGNCAMQNSMYIPVQAHGTSVAPGTLRPTPTSQIPEPLNSHSALSDPCASPDGSQATTSASESPQSVIKQELSDIPEETNCSPSSPTVPVSTSFSASNQQGDDVKQSSNINYSISMHNTPLMTDVRIQTQTLQKTSTSLSEPSPSVHSTQSAGTVILGSQVSHFQTQQIQSQPLGPLSTLNKHPPNSLQVSISTNSSTKPRDNNALYHSTKF